jgi:hypothetical protein
MELTIKQPFACIQVHPEGDWTIGKISGVPNCQKNTGTRKIDDKISILISLVGRAYRVPRDARRRLVFGRQSVSESNCPGIDRRVLLARLFVLHRTVFREMTLPRVILKNQTNVKPWSFCHELTTSWYNRSSAHRRETFKTTKTRWVD